MKERWWLDLVPRFMRTWPGLRRYYWQAEEIAWIEAEADRLQQLFGGDPAQCRAEGKEERR